jgi:hypothetical protein
MSASLLHPKTELARLRVAADLTPSEAAEEAALFLGPCSLSLWAEMELNPEKVPPAILARFKVLANRAERRKLRGRVTR